MLQGVWYFSIKGVGKILDRGIKETTYQRRRRRKDMKQIDEGKFKKESYAHCMLVCMISPLTGWKLREKGPGDIGVTLAANRTRSE